MSLSESQIYRALMNAGDTNGAVSYVSNTAVQVEFSIGEYVDEWATMQARNKGGRPRNEIINALLDNRAIGDKQISELLAKQANQADAATVNRRAVYITISQIVDGVPDPSKVKRKVTQRDIQQYPLQWVEFCRQHNNVDPQTGRLLDEPKPKFRITNGQAVRVA